MQTVGMDKSFFDSMSAEFKQIFVTADMPNEVRQQRIINFEGKLNHYLNQQPHHPGLLFMVGGFYLNVERSGLAITLFEKCLRTKQIEDKYKVFINLGGAYKMEHNDDMAEHYYSQAVASARASGDKGAMAHALHGLGSLYINRGEPQKCIDYCRRALELDPNDRFANWNLGIACLEAGLWEEGGRLYHTAGFIASDTKPMERKLKTYGGLPSWDGSPGKTVIVYGEQGVGDEVMFASIIPDMMKDAKVIIDCDKRIPTLLKRSFPEAVAVYPTSDINDPFPWVADHKIDARIAMGSLMHFYRKKASDFPKVPYLKADPEKRKKWRQVLDAMGPGKHVAISYAGGLKKTRQDMRTIHPEKVADFLKVPGIHWHSIQYHDWGPDNAAILGTKTGVPFHHWHDVIKDWDEWAAFLSEIDLLITVNTSVHHLAGSLGVRQWCLTPKYVAWRYGTSGPSPFYGACSMYRQGKDLKWEPVIERVLSDLERWRDGGSDFLHQEEWVVPEAVAGGGENRPSGSHQGIAVANRKAGKRARGRKRR